MTRLELEFALKSLPRPLVGSLAFQTRDDFRLRDSCLRMMEEVMELAKPRRILEIGTHAGHSACLLLAHSDAHVVSVDIGHTWTTWEAGFNNWGEPGGGGLKQTVGRLRELFPNRFTFILGDSTAPDTFVAINDHAPYDLAFIDGDHSYQYVCKDIQTMLVLGVPYLLIDDCTTPNEDTWRAAVAHELTLVKRFPSIHNVANVGVVLWRNPTI